MFDFLKKKKSLPTFAPLVTDIHCHLLPMVDDGSKSVEESLDVMEAMKECGFEEIRLTPHFNYPRFPNKADDIKHRYDKFCSDVEACKGDRQIPRMTSITGEYQVGDGFDEYLESGQLLTYKTADPSQCSEKGIVLIEFSLHQKRMGIEDTVYTLLTQGYDIILAHPERYPYFDSHSGLLEQFKEQGVYFQVNILSLDGFYGEAPLKKSFEYIENGWVELLGTDMHNVAYAQALRHASVNKRIIKLLEKHEFDNKKFALGI